MARGDDVEQQLHLIGLQSLALRIARSTAATESNGDTASVNSLRHRDRRLEYPRRMNHVAEVENPADRLAVGVTSKLAPWQSPWMA